MASTQHLPDPASSPELFEGLLKRRVMAYLIDVMLLGVITIAVGLVMALLGIFTFGLTWLLMRVTILAAIIAYYAFTLGSERRATPGMMIMDIVVTPVRNAPLEGWRAIALPLLFWLTCWILPIFSLLVALFTPRRQMLHDLIIGVLLVRRSPMERHWRNPGPHGMAA